jgi:hypothetical protein
LPFVKDDRSSSTESLWSPSRLAINDSFTCGPLDHDLGNSGRCIGKSS